MREVVGHCMEYEGGRRTLWIRWDVAGTVWAGGRSHGIGLIRWEVAGYCME